MSVPVVGLGLGDGDFEFRTFLEGLGFKRVKIWFMVEKRRERNIIEFFWLYLWTVRSICEKYEEEIKEEKKEEKEENKKNNKANVPQYSKPSIFYRSSLTCLSTVRHLYRPYS